MKKTFTILLSFITLSLYSQSENWKIYNNLNSPLPNNKITSTIIDNEGKMFFGTHNGLVVYDGETWKNYNVKNSLISSNKILDISVDNFNNKWIGTSSGLVLYKEGEFKTINTKNSNLPSDKIRQTIIKGSKKYLATEKGVVIISLKDTIIINKQTKKLPDENIITLQVDNKGNIWVGTNSGLIYYNKKELKFFNKENSKLPDNHIWSLKTDKEVIWAGTKKGLVKISDTDWEVFTKKNSGLPSNIITDITKDEYNRIWIGTTKGMTTYNGYEWKNYKTKKNLKTIFSIYIDKNDNKWISTEKALIVLNEQGVSVLNNKKTKKPSYFKVLDNTKIEYFLPQSSNVEIKIYNNQGELVDVVLEEKMLKGKHHFYYNTDRLTVGSYLCRFKTKKLSSTKKLIVMK